MPNEYEKSKIAVTAAGPAIYSNSLSGHELPATAEDKKYLIVNNTDVVTSLNVAGKITVPIMGTVVRNDLNATVDSTLNEITFNTDYTINIAGYVAFKEDVASNNARLTLAFRIEKDTGAGFIPVSPPYQDNYLRDATGQTEVGQGFAGLQVLVSSGDKLKLTSQKITTTGAGNVTLDGTLNYITICVD